MNPRILTYAHPPHAPIFAAGSRDTNGNSNSSLIPDIPSIPSIPDQYTPRKRKPTKKSCWNVNFSLQELWGDGVDNAASFVDCDPCIML